MTRPLTKREFALVATPLVAKPLVAKPIGRHSRRDSALPLFLIVSVARGVAIGIFFAALALFTDTLGIFALVKAQPAPATATLVFGLLCSVKFIPVVLAASLALAARSR